MRLPMSDQRVEKCELIVRNAVQESVSDAGFALATSPTRGATRYNLSRGWLKSSTHLMNTSIG